MTRMLCPSLIGREAQAAQLDDAVGACIDHHHGGLVVVAGTAGIGKSRLVGEAAAEARIRGATVLTGRAVPSDVPAPYRPLEEALVAATRGMPPDSEPLRGFRAALGRLVPAWRENPDSVADESPVVVAEAVLRVLRELAGAGGCVLVLEDVHWADPETLHAMEYLADHAAALPVLCLATLRDDRRTLALDAMTRLEARRAVDVIRLAPLGAGDVAVMARTCLGAATLPPEVDTLLRDGADGVPFLVEELLAAAIASSMLRSTGDGWQVTGTLAPLVPRSFADTVHERLDRAGPVLRRLLGTAALLGRQFDWRLAAGAARCAPGAAHQFLEHAVALQLLAADGNVFIFRHALTRDAILAALLPSERAALAADALKELEASAPDGDDWRHLAADLPQAAGDDEHAARLLLAAGRSSLQRGALVTATAALERGARSGASARTRAEIEEALAGARAAAGDVAGTEAAVTTLLRTLDGIGAPPARRGQAHLLLARAAVAANQFDLAGAELVLARGLAVAGNDGALAARVEAVAAHIAIGEGRLDDAETIAARAFTAAQGTAQPEVACEALEVATRCARTRNLDEAAGIAARALQIAEEHTLPLWRMRALYQAGIVELFRGFDVTMLQRTRAEAQRLGAVATVASLDVEIGAGLEAQGRLDEAVASCECGIEIASLLGLGQLEAVGHAFIAITHAERGARRRMEERLARAAALVGESERELTGAMWGDARAIASLVEEDRARARADLDRATALYADQESATPRLGLALRALILSIDGVEVPAVTGITLIVCQSAGYLAYADAVRLGRAGRVAAAAAAAERGDRLLARLPWYRHLMRRLTAEAAIAGCWGDPAAWLTEAATFFADRGNGRLASACRDLLRRSGVRVARPTSGARALPARLRDAGVTAREAEVLALVADGLSNREIASRLYLSERTVEHHVGWLRRKLDATSRAQLVAFAMAGQSPG